MKKRFLVLMALLSLLVSSCNKDDDDSNASFQLNITGLENLGTDYVYEGWLIVNGNPVSTGVFSVDDNGQLSNTAFDVDASNLTNATTFVLSIEPANDPDPAPSAVKILAGDFNANTASLSIAPVVGTFDNALGDYFLATPTNGNTTPLSGLWFIDVSSGSPAAGLKNLPTLPDGWAYEGWVVLNGTPLSTGTFRSAEGADDSAPFSGTMPGPPFPGEDFLTNAPSGLSFPTDLSGATVVVSVEPVPDNSPNPFTLKPLAGSVPSNAVGGTAYSIGFSSSSFPTGTVTR